MKRICFSITIFKWNSQLWVTVSRPAADKGTKDSQCINSMWRIGRANQLQILIFTQYQKRIHLISRARIPLMLAFYAKFSSKSYFLLPFNSGASERIRVWLRQKIKKTNSSCWHFMQNFLITNPIPFIFATIIFMDGRIY